MPTITGVKGDIATTLSFLQSLRAARDTLAIVTASPAGITGVSKAAIASTTIDAILKATESDRDDTAVRPDAHGRFDLGDAETPIEDDAEAHALISPRGTDPAHEASVSSQRPDSVEPERAPAAGPAHAPARDAAAAHAAAEPRPRPDGFDPGPRQADPHAGTGAVPRDYLGPTETSTRPARRKRSDPQACERCGRALSEQPCTCATPKPPFFGALRADDDEAGEG